MSRYKRARIDYPFIYHYALRTTVYKKALYILNWPDNVLEFVPHDTPIALPNTANCRDLASDDKYLYCAFNTHILQYENNIIVATLNNPTNDTITSLMTDTDEEGVRNLYCGDASSNICQWKWQEGQFQLILPIRVGPPFTCVHQMIRYKGKIFSRTRTYLLKWIESNFIIIYYNIGLQYIAVYNDYLYLCAGCRIIKCDADKYISEIHKSKEYGINMITFYNNHIYYCSHNDVVVLSLNGDHIMDLQCDNIGNDITFCGDTLYCCSNKCLIEWRIITPSFVTFYKQSDEIKREMVAWCLVGKYFALPRDIIGEVIQWL